MRNFLPLTYFLYLIIISGNAIQFFRSDVGVVVLFIITVFIMFFKRISVNKTLLKILFVWFVYYGISTVAIGSFHPLFMIIIPTYILSSYIVIALLGNRIILYYEKFIYYLSCISLFFFLWQIISPSLLYQLLAAFDISENKRSIGTYYSILVYTVNQWNPDAVIRNAGFCWEPGPFSCFIILGILFNLIRNKFKFAHNRIFWVLFITLLTTQSTTGLSIFMLIIIWAFVNSKAYYKGLVFLVPILIIGLYFAFTEISYLSEKIKKEYEQKDQLSDIIDRTRESDKLMAPGRFLSFEIAWKDFIERPLWGYGGNVNLQWFLQEGAYVSPVSGIGGILARYGLFGFICWVILLLKSNTYLYEWGDKYRFKHIWFLLVIFISIGFGIIISPLFFAFYLLPYFYKKYIFRTKISVYLNLNHDTSICYRTAESRRKRASLGPVS